MGHENELKDDERPEPVEVDRGGADDAAQRRSKEFDASLTECEHHDIDRDKSAAAATARIIDQWDKTSDPRVRERLLDDVGHEMMKVHEAPPPELHPKEMVREQLGAYIDQDFRTEINRDLLKQDDPTDGLDAYLHEYRHAEQAYEVQKSHGPMARAGNTERATALEFNETHYISPEDGQSDYERQLLEVDAERFAESGTTEILSNRDALRAEGRSEAPRPETADEVAAWRLAADEPEDGSN